MDDLATTLIVRRFATPVDYRTAWQAMTQFTDTRTQDTPDELWLLEHPPVFTQGQAGKAEHLLMPGDIEVVQVDRGGQVTYHGPGQLVAYPLINLRRKKMGVRDLVTEIEQTIVDTLKDYQLKAYAKADAPGVYVDGADSQGRLHNSDKIASLGLRVRKGASFHGLALNVDADLSPFGRINPCGYQGLQMTRLSDWQETPASVADVAETLRSHLAKRLNYSECLEADPVLPEPMPELIPEPTEKDPTN